MRSRTYEVGRSTISLIFGDITTSKAEVLVSSDDYFLSMGGGVSASILRAGGPRIASDVSLVASEGARPRLGNVVVSTAGDLPAKYVFHAVTIGKEVLPPDAIVRHATLAAMRLLAQLGCRSIAFPAIGAGVAGIPLEVVASQMAVSLVGFLMDAPDAYRVELYLMDRYGLKRPDDYFVFFEEFAARKMGVSAQTDAARSALTAPMAEAHAPSAEEQEYMQRRHQVFLMLRQLDTRRNQIEAAILRALAEPEAPQPLTLAQLNEQLEGVNAIRRNYQVELVPSNTAAESVVANSVFVSSTSEDLKPYRLAVRRVIDGMQMKFIGMEEFAPEAQAPADLIRRKVRQSKVYLGILGLRYGYVDPGTGLSMTELEYHQAVASAKPIQMFVIDKNATIRANMVEEDPTKYAKLLEFKSRVMKDHTCTQFTDEHDLADKAEAALKEALPA
ncbi:MAG: DUF4062 domain-containing protein [Acidobacteria bacterium]|nr:DUF4062 domain-containing protein [Acidobacteriota bacterium]